MDGITYEAAREAIGRYLNDVEQHKADEEKLQNIRLGNFALNVSEPAR